MEVREWFAEVHRRIDMGLDPFQSSTGRTDGGREVGSEMHGDASGATEEQQGLGDEDDDEVDEGDEGDDTDDSEVWEPSRSVRKSLSVSED